MFGGAVEATCRMTALGRIGIDGLLMMMLFCLSAVISVPWVALVTLLNTRP